MPWERAARGIALALIAWAFVQLFAANRAATAPEVHVHVEGGLAAGTRDSLTALARAGARVTWSGDVAALATTSEPVRDPSGRTRIVVAGGEGVTLADSLGPIDSLGGSGGALTTSGLAGLVRVVSRSGAMSGAMSGATSGASTIARLAPSPGRVLVLGRVGWEAKFTVAALEEAGWLVDTRLALSDTMTVRQGRTDLTVASHAAVVVLDSVLVADAATLSRFVRGGGGLVLAGAGAGAGAAARPLAALAPARAGRPEAGERDGFERGEPLHALPFVPLTNARADAVVLESRDGQPAILARRVASGRVVQSAYAETWRWRMQGEGNGVREHREFWTRIVGAAAASAAAAEAATASAPEIERAARIVALDESPRATLVQRLGASVPDAPASAPPVPALPAWIGALALVLLVGEWASRRARGAA